MSGAGVGETPNAAFAALSARGSSLGIAGLPSGITELEHFLKTGDDKAFTEGQDRRCRALNGLGLSKADKVTLAAVSMFQTGDDLDKWMESVFTVILLHQGGAALQHWVHETNFLDNGLQPPPNLLHEAVHKFTPRDADTATLEAMVERGELHGALPRFAPRSLGIGDEVELLVQMPTEIDGETRNEWIDQKATIVKVEAGRYFIHIEADLADGKVAWYEAARVRRALRTPLGYSTPRHGGLPRDDETMPRQVGPRLDRGLLDAGIYNPAIHQLWMCYLIYARLPLNAQRLDKTLLPMFLAKIYDQALREACGAAAGGRFSKAAVKLYAHVGMNPGKQLVVDLNNMNMDYTGLDTLALQLPRRQLALGKATHEQRLVWEALCVLDEAQHRERDQDIARALRQIRDRALADFTNNPHDGAAIYERTSKAVTDQVAVHVTQHAIRDGIGSGAGGHEGGAHNTDTHTDDDVHNEQLQAEKPGLSDHMGGKVQRDVCLNAASYLWAMHR